MLYVVCFEQNGLFFQLLNNMLCSQCTVDLDIQSGILTNE